MQLNLAGKIKCVTCGKNYIRRKERNHYKWVCSGWSNYGVDFCLRYAISEDELAHLISKHLMLTGGALEGDLEGFVEVVNVDTKNKSYTIVYTDKSTSEITPNRLKY